MPSANIPQLAPCLGRNGASLSHATASKQRPHARPVRAVMVVLSGCWLHVLPPQRLSRMPGTSRAGATSTDIIFSYGTAQALSNNHPLVAKPAPCLTPTACLAPIRGSWKSQHRRTTMISSSPPCRPEPPSRSNQRPSHVVSAPRLWLCKWVRPCHKWNDQRVEQ